MTKALGPLLFIVGSTAFAATDALASMCFRPQPPRCSSYLSASSDRWEFEDCRAQIERFQSEVRNFTECQRDEQETVIRELNEEIRQFNACARDRLC